jgi:hypothetical protein
MCGIHEGVAEVFYGFRGQDGTVMLSASEAKKIGEWFTRLAAEIEKSDG